MGFFFFQAEDGIRDGRVTGVQTCALPILNEATYTVVGVLPDWFQFPSWVGVYLPLSTVLPTDRILAQRGFHADSRIVAKLKPAVSIKQAQAAMAAIQSRLATAYPADNRGWTR